MPRGPWRRPPTTNPEPLVAPPRHCASFSSIASTVANNHRQVAGVEGRQVALGVEEQPVVDDLDVERRGVVDEPRHDVGGEQVQRVALVPLRAVQREVPVEIALEAQPLVAAERDRQVRAAEQTVVAHGIQHDMGERGVEPQRDVAPAVRLLALSRPGLVRVVGHLERARLLAPHHVVQLLVAAEVEDHPGRRGWENPGCHVMPFALAKRLSR